MTGGVQRIEGEPGARIIVTRHRVVHEDPVRRACVRSRQRLIGDGHDAVPVLPGALRHELLDPQWERGHTPRGRKRQLVPTTLRAEGQDRSQSDGGIHRLRQARRAFALELAGPFDDALDVCAHQYHGEETEHGQGGVASTDIGRRLE